MPAVDRPLSGEELLLFAVTEAMVVFHQRYYHRRDGLLLTAIGERRTCLSSIPAGPPMTNTETKGTP
jgi:hypothetical protein